MQVLHYSSIGINLSKHILSFMSSNIINEQAKSVDNGIKIIEFIQKNQEQLQKTHGRSAITGPPTRIRAEEWEKYLSNQNGTTGGLSDQGSSIPRTEEESSKGRNSGSGVSLGSASISESNNNQSTSDRDNQRGNAEDLDGKSQQGRGISRSDSDPSIVVRDTDQSGDKEPRGCSQTSMRPVQDVERMGGSSVSNQHPTPTRRGITVIDKLSEGDDVFDEVLQSDPAEQERRLKNTNKLRGLLEIQDTPVGPIKKGTEGNIVSMYSKGPQPSESGAIQSVLESESSRYKRSVSADTAQESASCASLTESGQTPFSLEEMHTKIDNLVSNQSKIIEKLNTVFEIKEEVNNIKKSVNNLSLAISTIESYISSLMIVIPGSGKNNNSDPTKPELNPDLRMVVGRDRTRGLNEVTTRQQRNLVEPFGEDIFTPPTLDSSVLLENVNKDRNHAARFIPSEDGISYKVIKAMIETKVDDKEIQQELIGLLDQNYGKIPLNLIYEEISQLLN
ncbi:phosphoprotein [Piparella virus]|nr:phosphoprotein [Piparella virus]